MSIEQVSAGDDLQDGSLARFLTDCGLIDSLYVDYLIVASRVEIEDWHDVAMNPTIAMNEALSTNYQQMNSRMSRKLVYRLTGRGFASEINFLISAILYCLIHNTQFVLNSKAWNASCGQGWQDHFVPFCQESSHVVNHKKMLHVILSSLKSKRRKDRLGKFNYPCQRKVWHTLRSEAFAGKEFSIPELGIQGDIFNAKRAVLKLIYRYNEQTGRLIENRIGDQLKEINPYAAVHIRRGDKVSGNDKEAELVGVKDYIDQILSVDADIKNVFLATDDGRVVEDFQRHCPAHWQLSTFCPTSREGHIQKAFNQMSQLEKKRAMIEIFADLQALSEAKWFIGTYSSNIGRLVALMRNNERCHSLDVPWYAG